MFFDLIIACRVKMNLFVAVFRSQLIRIATENTMTAKIYFATRKVSDAKYIICADYDNVSCNKTSLLYCTLSLLNCVLYSEEADFNSKCSSSQQPWLITAVNYLRSFYSLERCRNLDKFNKNV